MYSGRELSRRLHPDMCVFACVSVGIHAFICMYFTEVFSYFTYRSLPCMAQVLCASFVIACHAHPWCRYRVVALFPVVKVLLTNHAGAGRCCVDGVGWRAWTQCSLVSGLRSLDLYNASAGWHLSSITLATCDSISAHVT